MPNVFEHPIKRVHPKTQKRIDDLMDQLTHEQAEELTELFRLMYNQGWDDSGNFQQDCN